MRNATIDYLKAILIIVMVLAHADFFLNQPSDPLTASVLKNFSSIMSLCVFSGLFFCFGYACQCSYLSKDIKVARPRMLATAWRTLAGYYIAAFAYQILFMGKGSYSIVEVVSVLLFIDIPEFCEFLITFFLMIVCSVIFFHPLKKMADKPMLVAILCLISLLSPFVIPYKAIQNHHLGLLVGILPRGHFYSFPLLQYAHFFIIGIFFARRNITFNTKYFFAALALFACYVSYNVITGHEPKRFPPSFFWLAGCSFPVYLFYLLAGYIANRNPKINWLNLIGYNALFYLIVSNILLFSLSKVLKMNGFMVIFIGIIILYVIYFFTSIIRKLPE